jgi:aspartyl-tRNA(Asn)/glutamyl-tRNA(Gln) amidotransferase subunit A
MITGTAPTTMLSLQAASELVRTKRISPVELTTACLERIEQLNPQLNAFITVTAELAMEQARAAEAEIAHGKWRGPLHGIPIALKDMIDTEGVRTTAASALFTDRVPPEDAEVVRRLKRAGAVLIGKTNLHEFAYGGSSVISHFGPVRNPADPALIAGGSSGGSAAAVASGMCYAALGTDTAGSIRVPAACCGIVGLKPSYGLVPIRGVLPLAWSFDHVGPLARTVEDVALVLAAIAGYDPEDMYSAEFVATDYTAVADPQTRKMPGHVSVSRLRIGVAGEFFFRDLHPEVAAGINAAIAALARITADVSEADITVEVDTDRVIQNAQTWTYHREYVNRSPELYHPETLRRIRQGEQVSVADYIHQCHRLRLLRNDAARTFREVDVIVSPVSPIPPPPISELEQDMAGLRAKELLMLRNTRPFNVLGAPALALGNIQLAAAPGQETVLLALAQRLKTELGPASLT